MDITDELKDKTGKNKPPLLPKPCVISPSNNGMEHVIPQMIITSADDPVEDNQNVFQTSTSEVFPSEISSDVPTNKETETVSSTQIVSHVPTTCDDKQLSENRIEDVVGAVLSNKVETKSEDPIPHTAVQRPLLIESEKSVIHSPIAEPGVICSSDPPIIESAPFTTMQRPLIFDSPHLQSETPPISQEQEKSEDNICETPVKVNVSGEESTLPEYHPNSDFESSDTAQQVFSPSASVKENFSYRDLDERDEMIQDGDKDKQLQPIKEVDPGHVKKDNLQNVKHFFDNLLHETHSESCKSGEENSLNTEGDSKKSKKSEKHSIKKLFSTSKTHSVAKERNISGNDELDRKLKIESNDQSKDSKYNIKKMFDSFKLDSSDQSSKAADKKKIGKTEEEIKVDDIKSHHKESKSGIKKFFDSFKHEESNALSAEIPIAKNDSKDISIEVPSSLQRNEEPLKIAEAVVSLKDATNSNTSREHDPSSFAECKESNKEIQKDSSHGVKKFFDSFKHDKPHVVKESNEKSHSEISKKNSIKKSHSFKESLLSSQATTSGDTKKEHVDIKGAKRFFDSFKTEGAQSQDSSKTLKEQKSIELKRSQSCRETISEKAEVSHGFRGFLDSLTHKKISGHPSHSDHIYDVVEKTAIPVENPSHIDLKSTIKVEGKNREDQSVAKNIFDSFRLKDTSAKMKTTSPLKKVRMSDDVAISSKVNEAACTSGYISNKESKVQSKKAISSKLKESDKVSVKTQKNAPFIQINDSPTVTDTKSSMFNSLSDNFSAFKDKIFQQKEDKKAPVEKETKFAAYDLANAATVEYPGESSGTYRPLSDFETQNSDKKVAGIRAENKVPAASLPVIQTSIKSAICSKATNKEHLNSDTNSKLKKSPETLYDTCCFKLAVLFSNKAIEMVSDKTKSPPKKPPKPTAEAIAKARANVVSQRLREMHSKGQSVGENIPVGYDGIRFADDETESSCDYKDVDNFDYIMDYELINRYKFDNKMDTFSDPSTCSGSYYTADTVTLKDETFSDAPLETISLSSNDSYLFHNLSSIKSESEGKMSPSATFSLSLSSKMQSSSKSSAGQKQTSVLSKPYEPNDVKKLKSSILHPNKKVPPPLPPKPIITPKRKFPQAVQSGIHSGEKTPVSQCINGLSLSPRLQPKLPKDTAATQKRPLMVAGLKETEFLSLQSKSKESKKQPKERKFDMVLKNESLKKISTISSHHQPLTSTKSYPEIAYAQTNNTSLAKKSTPQRPPLPQTLIRSDDKNIKQHRVAPKVPEKPKRDNASPTVGERRTLSPPRPPPPTSIKLNVPPPRPPPPIIGLQSPEKISSQILKDQDIFSADSLKDKQESTISIDCSPVVSLKIQESNSPFSTEIPCNSVSSEAENSLQLEPEICTENLAVSCELADNIKLQDFPSNKYEMPEEHTVCNQNFDIANVCGDSEQTSSRDAVVVEEMPKPPPRIRRVRSRNVEVTKIENTPEQTLRRSQSLSDIDLKKRTSHLNAFIESVDLKHLYTSVNKNGKKFVLDQSQSSSLEKLSGRPLPAPPPPPRKFHSLERKAREKEKREIESSPIFENNVETIETANLQIYPPVRKKKSDKHRFHSLGHDHARNDSKTRFPAEDAKLPRSLSVPLRPERRLKHPNVEYDENANVAFPVEAEVHNSDIILDECGNEIQNPNIPSCDVTDSVHSAEGTVKVIPNPRRKKEKDKNLKMKSRSSWYNESQASEEFELVDWTPTEEAESRFFVTPKNQPIRRRSDPGKGARRSSKFYVDVQLETGLLPLVDKETSPVPLDCSEKSVQTSLETLSQGMTSRDEGDDDTDDLLDLAQTLQNELKVIINRHKSTSDVGNDSSATNTPVLSATDSEGKNIYGDSRVSKLKKSSSIRSSNSEIWPLTSSEESDNELPPEGSLNLTEIAVRRKQKKIFYIAQEIMTSEELFVDALKLLNVDFKAAVESSNQQKGTAVVPEEVLSQILNHLPQLQHLNENLLMELKDRIDNWDKIGKIADIIVKMGPFLKLYSWYIHDFEYNVSLLEDSKKKYPLFGQVVKEFETSVRCKRLALNHFMLKPIQRIPQYRLLLQEYLHHLPEEHVDYQDTVAALQIVSEVATHANDSMKHGDNAQKLISIQNSIMGHKEIIKPGRLFVKEGELMKLSRKGMQPRWFVLFNDLLLYLTPVQQGLFRVNHELPLTGMKVAIPIQEDYQNEFSIISVARSFTLAAKSPEERQEWIIALTKAIEENASKRSTFTNIRLQQKAHEKASEEDEGEFVLGRKAPVWIPDARVTMCQLCTSEFTVTFRRHHCRACGKVVCSICSSNRISLPYLGNRIARVCDDCHCKLGPGSGTCTESAETDSDNQQIAIKPHLRTENRLVKKGKRNLPSVLKEVCANDQGSTISGYLQKKSGKSWKRDWFVVKDKVLYEYKASEDVAALRSLPLLGYQIEPFSEAYENIDPSLLFQLSHPGQAPIVFHAETVGSTERWISALKEASVLE